MSEAEATTMLLRFRDVGKPPGQTLGQHKALIRRRGYVWWAWWTMAGERVPQDLFTRFQNEAVMSGLRVFLYDAGQSLVYAASLRDIGMQDDGAPLPTPEPSWTPGYHRLKLYHAWFKFDEIIPERADLVTEWAYVQVEGFLQTESPMLARFYGKRIDSLSELHDQECATWFVRPCRAADRVGPITPGDSPGDASEAAK